MPALEEIMLHANRLGLFRFGNSVRLSAWAAAVVLALLLSGHAGWAEDKKNDRAVRLLQTVPIPPNTTNNTHTPKALFSFDISWVDQASRTYYLADRSNKAVDIVDTTSNLLITQLAANPAFRGFTACSAGGGANDCAGPNGVATSTNCLFVTDAPSRVVSFNKATLAQVSDVQTDPTDPTRADELAVDPKDSLILAINNASSPPFGTFVTFDPTTCTLTPPDPKTDRVTFDLGHGVNATNGAEQPIWDPGTQKFYVSIPQIGPAVEEGGVVRIDPKTKTVDQTFGIKFCSPAGLTLGPNEDVLVGCNTVFNTAGKLWTAIDPLTAAPIQVILNVVTGEQTQVAGVGVGDEVWFNKGDGNYYTASSTSPLRPLDVVPSPPVPPLTAQGAAILGVIDAKDKKVLQLVPTFNVPQVPPPPAAPTGHPAGTAHSVAVDATNNHIFVPLAANNVFPDCTTGCIAVYWHGDEDKSGEAATP
jgi:hypothetical protein